MIPSSTSVSRADENVDKFDGYTTAKRADNGIYYITEGTNAYISAKVVQSVDLGNSHQCSLPM